MLKIYIINKQTKCGLGNWWGFGGFTVDPNSYLESSASYYGKSGGNHIKSKVANPVLSSKPAQTRENNPQFTQNLFLSRNQAIHHHTIIHTL